MSSSWHIWASANMMLTSLVTFAKQFIKRPSGVDHKRAVPQMSLLFENLNQCMLLHKHIIQSLPSLEATHTFSSRREKKTLCVTNVKNPFPQQSH